MYLVIAGLIRGCCCILEAVVQKESIFRPFLFPDYLIPECPEVDLDDCEQQDNLEVQLGIEEIVKRSQKVKRENKDSDKRLGKKLENQDDSDVEDNISLEDFPEVAYSFSEEQLFLNRIYGQAALDYLKLWYGENKPANFRPEEEYLAEMILPDNSDSDVLTTEEAQETLQEIQYAALLGTPTAVDSEQRKKFDFWIKFNPALFKLFEMMYSLTRDVDYRHFA